MPNFEEVKSTVFNMNKESAPGPYGFGSFFFLTYWDIVAQDVIDEIIQFFRSGWIIPNFNSNSIVLIPKSKNADPVDHFRPIGLANYKFNIITKIIGQILAQMMLFMISPNQRDFIRGRKIKDYLCMKFEAIDVWNIKASGDNLALKIDIKKTFDTIKWSLLIQVIRKFSFNDMFCGWMEVILKSVKLSISINGN
ncbi:uncharacterized protein LOC131642172 [Vicia villosa]|uniref:uncharacterized protein LOC131642172 n=1 Tax=Vicia villosa TaxID=3911 RepID=UPI00273BCD80|nr:uncharacterized protein LOC131642172 [Vicia villosa]